SGSHCAAASAWRSSMPPGATWSGAPPRPWPTCIPAPVAARCGRNCTGTGWRRCWRWSRNSIRRPMRRCWHAGARPWGWSPARSRDGSTATKGKRRLNARGGRGVSSGGLGARPASLWGSPGGGGPDPDNEDESMNKRILLLVPVALALAGAALVASAQQSGGTDRATAQGDQARQAAARADRSAADARREAARRAAEEARRSEEHTSAL